MAALVQRVPSLPIPNVVFRGVPGADSSRTADTRMSRFIRSPISASPASQPWPERFGGTTTRAVMAKSGTPLVGAGVHSESAASMLMPRSER